MRKLSPTEWAGLCLAAVLVFGGAWLTLFPKEMVGRRASNNRIGGDTSYVIKLSKKECRVYGILSVVTGLSLGALAVYPLKEPPPRHKTRD